METRQVHSKQENKTSTRHKTEWEQQLPNRFLCRTDSEVVVKSSVVKTEITIIKNNSSPTIERNMENIGQYNQRNGINYGGSDAENATAPQAFINSQIPNQTNKFFH
ncbi:hypothetical protein CEXT_72141 [Caerostris extrusa]|uniref:Uncharacterized protein n=1 Tax=Caerostris extrusa TaxID=172846 RepID=A0AAV4VCR8_CAEEX|nr:hypothetical protein CEXT_72141 [Caerostris extrusa]